MEQTQAPRGREGRWAEGHDLEIFTPAPSPGSQQMSLPGNSIRTGKDTLPVTREVPSTARCSWLA